MLKRQFVVALLGTAWLLVATFVSVFTVAIVVERGLGDVPALTWVLVVLVYGVGLPALLYVWSRWGRGERSAEA